MDFIDAKVGVPRIFRDVGFGLCFILISHLLLLSQLELLVIALPVLCHIVDDNAACKLQVLFEILFCVLGDGFRFCGVLWTPQICNSVSHLYEFALLNLIQDVKHSFHQLVEMAFLPQMLEGVLELEEGGNLLFLSNIVSRRRFDVGLIVHRIR